MPMPETNSSRSTATKRHLTEERRAAIEGEYDA